MRIRNPFLKSEYILQEPLGFGLTSRVYKAIRRHRTLGVEQTVALKILNSKNQVLALKNEIHILSKIRSVHCVQLLGWEELSIGSALVLEYLEGVSLLEFMSSGSALSQDLIDEMTAQVQEGLRELNENNIFHGDLSPRNIFVTKQGIIKLLDFGFSGVCRPGEFYGTPQYISPEIWLGQDPNSSSDLFSLGLLRADLMANQLIADKAHSHWQQRTLDMIGKNDLLAADPKDRRFLDLESRRERREQLALKVQCVIDLQKSYQATQRVERPKFSKKESRSLVWKQVLLSLMTFFFYHQIQTASQSLEPLPLREMQRIWRLDVRSHRWAAMILKEKNENGREFKSVYAPHTFKNLKEGFYEMHYRSSKGSGMINFKLDGNRRIVLE